MFLHPFKQKTELYDFSLIANVIKEFYPGIRSKRPTPETVGDSLGFKKKGKIAFDEFIEKKAYSNKW